MYAELHCHSHFSMLDGASSPAALVDRAVELGMSHLAITDHNGLYGAVRFYTAARARGITPIIGLEVELVTGHHLTLLARDNLGYRSLCRLVSRAQLKGSKHEPRFEPADLALHTEGLFALSGCRHGEVAAALLGGKLPEARAAAAKLAMLYGEDSFWIELQDHQLPDSRSLCMELGALADELGLGCAATNNVHYAERDGYRLQDVLACIHNGVALDESAGVRRPNAEYYLKGHEEMSALFVWRPDAVENAGRIASLCSLDLSFSQHRHPQFPLPEGYTRRTYLHKLCMEGAVRRYGSLGPDVLAQLRHELSVIAKLGLENFFIVVWDIMRYAREHGIPAQGRGSAADSVVAYVLGITRVDPIRYNLLFERFLNEERAGMPDIDIDVSTNHREQLIQYVYDRYGVEHTAMVATVITYRARSAVREVGKALGFPPDVLDAAAKSLDMYSGADRLREEVEAALGEAPPAELPWGQLVEMCTAIEGFPRHLSIHVGGMLVTDGPLVDVVPVEHATAPGRVVTQYDKDDVEDVGLIKIDLLGLRTLSMVYDILQQIEQSTGERLDLDALPEDDPQVYEMLCRGDSIGVFQVESRAQSQTLPKMQPRTLDDLVVEVALIRPGPLQGNMVHPYLRRRQGVEPVTYLHPKLEPILVETLGVCMFQEQVIRIATDVAGFRPGEADMFRRAMGSHRSRDEMERIHDRFIEGARSGGVPLDAAEELFRQLAGFASFGFCKSHAAAFARTTYETAWLKLHYPAAFYTALMNNQPMGFYSPEVVLGDARRHGVRILPVDVNRSGSKCRVEHGALRLGFCYVQDIGERALATLDGERKQGQYGSFEEFCRRTGLDRDSTESLIFAGAFDRLQPSRRRLLWELNRVVPQGSRSRSELPVRYRWLDPELREMTQYEQVAEEYLLMGLSSAHHVLEFHRDALRSRGVLTAEEVRGRQDGEVTVAGMVVCRQQPPTAKGHVFLTLEDETGLVNVILRPKVFEQYRQYVRRSPLLVITGRLQADSGVYSVLGSAVEPWREASSHEAAAVQPG